MGNTGDACKDNNTVSVDVYVIRPYEINEDCVELLDSYAMRAKLNKSKRVTRIFNITLLFPPSYERKGLQGIIQNFQKIQ